MQAVLWLEQHTRVSATSAELTDTGTCICTYLISLVHIIALTSVKVPNWSHLRRFRSELCLSGLQPLYFPRVCRTILHTPLPRVCRTILHTPLPLAGLLPLQHTSRAAWIKFLEDASTASPSADPKDPALPGRPSPHRWLPHTALHDWPSAHFHAHLPQWSILWL